MVRASRMAPDQPAPSTPPTWQQMSPPAGATPTAPAHNPMAVHVKVIAVLEIVWGVLAIIGALLILFAFSVGTAAVGSAEDSGAPGWITEMMASLGILIALIVGALAAVALMGGIRLLNLRRSGKVPTYVAAALSLFWFPIGTAFGIYAIIILTRPDTDRLLANP